jgi:hypothetical protein
VAGVKAHHPVGEADDPGAPDGPQASRAAVEHQGARRQGAVLVAGQLAVGHVQDAGRTAWPPPLGEELGLTVPGQIGEHVHRHRGHPEMALERRHQAGHEVGELGAAGGPLAQRRHQRGGGGEVLRGEEERRHRGEGLEARGEGGDARHHRVLAEAVTAVEDEAAAGHVQPALVGHPHHSRGDEVNATQRAVAIRDDLAPLEGPVQGEGLHRQPLVGLQPPEGQRLLVLHVSSPGGRRA